MESSKINPPDRLVDYFNPYEVKTDANAIKESCELCISLSCCPEHSCNVSCCV